MSEVLISAVILGLFLAASLRSWSELTAMERHRRHQQQLLAWMELQLQRDQGLLHQQARRLALNCADPEQVQQGLQTLQAAWHKTAPLPSPTGASANASLKPAGDGLLVLQLVSGEHQRMQRYSLQGLGACRHEPG